MSRYHLLKPGGHPVPPPKPKPRGIVRFARGVAMVVLAVGSVVGAAVLVTAILLAVTSISGCLETDYQQELHAEYRGSPDQAVADFKAAYAAAVEVDSTATLIALVGLIQKHGLPVAPFGYGREMWRWPLAECGSFAVKYRVHYEADFIVDLPEFAVWADTTRMVGSVLQVAGIDTSWNMGGFSVPGVTGAGVLAEYPLAAPCDNAGGE